MIMRNDEMMWRAMDRRRAEFMRWGRREFAVALRRQYNQWENAGGGSEAEMLRALGAITSEPIWDAMYRVYEKVAGTFAVDTEKLIRNRNGAKSFNVKDRTVSDYQDQIRAWVNTKCSEKVVDMVEVSIKSLQGIIGKAFDEGLSIEDTSRAIRAKFQDMSKVRAERIARTEVVGASNMGAMAGARATGLTLMKQWISTQDNRTRVEPYDHYGYNLTMVEMDGKFVINGDEIEYPGDPAGQPGNIINCRCTVVFVEGVPNTSPVIQPAPEEIVDDFTIDYSARVGSVTTYQNEYDEVIRETLRDLKIKGKVEFVFDKMAGSTGGFVRWLKDPDNLGEYTMGRQVTLNAKNTRDYGMVVIRHELRHVWQGTAGMDKARIKLNPSDGRMWIYWDNKPYITVQQFTTINKNLHRGKNYQRYLDFPWEVDARKYAGQV